MGPHLHRDRYPKPGVFPSKSLKAASLAQGYPLYCGGQQHVGQRCTGQQLCWRRNVGMWRLLQNALGVPCTSFASPLMVHLMLFCPIRRQEGSTAQYLLFFKGLQKPPQEVIPHHPARHHPVSTFPALNLIYSSCFRILMCLPPNPGEFYPTQHRCSLI